MTRDEKLLAAMKLVLAAELHKEITLLQRKLKHALEQRDDWKERATSYRKTILERQDEQRI